MANKKRVVKRAKNVVTRAKKTTSKQTRIPMKMNKAYSNSKPTLPKAPARPARILRPTRRPALIHV